MTPIRVYADTSVFGGVFDPEFERSSRMFFDQARLGRFRLVYSALVRDEAMRAPPQVLELFRSLEASADAIDVTPEAFELHEAYLTANIVTPNSAADALHVALATVAACRMIVSWNFRHIVNARRMPLYNGVNAVRGYPPLGIHSPPEVVVYDR